MEANDFRRVNTALIEKGFLILGDGDNIEEFGHASRSAYRDFLETIGRPQLTAAVAPFDMSEVPDELFEEVAFDEVEAANEAAASIEEQQEPPVATIPTETDVNGEQGEPSTINLTGGADNSDLNVDEAADEAPAEEEESNDDEEDDNDA